MSKNMDLSAKTIDEYIANYPKQTQTLLKETRETIHKAVPEATEKISYGIPTFVLNGNLVHFGGYKTHIGFYPGGAPLEEFADKLTGYQTSKGTVQFPLNAPIPHDLITDITLYCAKRNLAKKK